MDFLSKSEDRSLSELEDVLDYKFTDLPYEYTVGDESILIVLNDDELRSVTYIREYSNNPHGIESEAYYYFSKEIIRYASSLAGRYQGLPKIAVSFSFDSINNQASFLNKLL